MTWIQLVLQNAKFAQKVLKVLKSKYISDGNAVALEHFKMLKSKYISDGNAVALEHFKNIYNKGR